MLAGLAARRAAGADRHAGLRQHLPAPGGARQHGRHRRPHQRRPVRPRRSAPAGRSTSTSSTASSCRPPGSASTGSRRPCRSSAACSTEPRTTFAGEHYRLTDAVCEPKPVQDPLPILIGAQRRAADARDRRRLRRRVEHLGHPGADRRTSRPCWTSTARGRPRPGVDRPDHAGPRRRWTARGRAAARCPPSAAPRNSSPRRWPRYAALGLDELIVPTGPLGDAAATIEAMELLRAEVFPNVG